MLIPVRVEYVYELNNAIPKIKAYSDLKQPTPVTGQTNCKVRGVSVILDAEGTLSKLNFISGRINPRQLKQATKILQA